MTVSVALGLVLQAVALLVVRAAIRGQWLRHTGALFLLVAVVFHGVTELVQMLFPGRNIFRRYVEQPAVDDWVLLVSVALLLYAVVYAAVIRRVAGEATPAPVDVSSLSLPWMAAAAVPLLGLSLVGAGAVDSSDTGADADGYLTGGLAVQFTVLLVAIVGSLTIVRFGRKWMLPILLVEVALLSLIGARLVVLAGCLLVLYGAAIAGIRPTRRQMITAVLVVMLLGASVSSARELSGRDAFAGQEDVGVRAEALLAGVLALPSGDTLDTALDDVVYRFDGNSYGAIVLDALDDGREPVGVTTVGGTLSLAVPSFLSPGKLDGAVADRSEKVYYQSAFGTPSRIDVLPGVLSSWVGYGGPLVLLVLVAALAVTLGAVDRWILRGSSSLAFILGMGIVQAALFYERGTQGIVLTLRGVLVLLAALVAVQWWRRRLTAAPAGQAASTSQ